MDVMSLLSGTPLVANVAQITGNNTTATNGTAFQKQLLGIVDAQTAASAENGEAAAVPAILLANSTALLAKGELTEEELDAMVEQLLDQLEQLNDAELNTEQMTLIESLLQQVTALVELISFSNDQAAKALLPGIHAEQQTTGQSGYASNDTLIKLADQLLILQQALQNGSGKVLSGQTAATVVGEQLQIMQAKIAELVQEVKLKQNEASVADASIVEAANEEGKTSIEAKSHLQRMAQEAAYAASASKMSESANVSTATNAANAEPAAVQSALPDFQLRSDNAREFLAQLSRSNSGASSAYVLADEFADTMKELIVQRFNVSSLNGVTEAKLSLTPEHLGHVDVKISMQNGVMTAIFQTETAMAKDALENQMVQLRASLAAQGITVEKIEVAQSQFASQLNQQQKQGSHNQQHGDNNSGTRDKEDTFEEELLVNVTNQELGFGRAVNETI